MAITKQVVTAHDHGSSQLSTSPNSNSSSKHAAKKQTVMQLSSHEAFQTGASPAPSLHKIPIGDGPYVRAKQVQLLEKDPDRAIALFWAAINARDRVDSALKDMAIVMKQQNRPDEAIEAIRSFRDRCSEQAQESLDNVLLDLYKKCGRLDDQIELLKHKLNLIHKGMAFNGKRTKTARSQGRKFQISIRQEATRLLGNLGWAYMQLSNYIAAEAVYRKALSIESDNNKLCNLGVCLLKQCRFNEAKVVLQTVTPVIPNGRLNSESHLKSYERSQELLKELDAAQINSSGSSSSHVVSSLDDDNNNQLGLITAQEFDLWTHWKLWEAPCTESAPYTALEVTSNHEIGMESAGDMKEVSEYNTPPSAMFDKKAWSASVTSTSDFKREIGPSNTRSQQKSYKNAIIDGLDGASSNLSRSKLSRLQSADINIADHTCWYNSSWTPQINQKPVARSLMQEERFSKPSLPSCRSHSLNNVGANLSFLPGESDYLIEFRVDSANLKPEGSKSLSFVVGGEGLIDSNMQLNTSATEAVMDFSCVDSVIESIVPDAPSASQAVDNLLNANTAVGDDHNKTSYQPSIELESIMSLQQHRLRIFQET